MRDSQSITLKIKPAQRRATSQNVVGPHTLLCLWAGFAFKGVDIMRITIKISIEDAEEIIAKFIEKEGYTLNKECPVVFDEDQEPCFYANANYVSMKNE